MHLMGVANPNGYILATSKQMVFLHWQRIWLDRLAYELVPTILAPIIRRMLLDTLHRVEGECIGGYIGRTHGCIRHSPS